MRSLRALTAAMMYAALGSASAVEVESRATVVPSPVPPGYLAAVRKREQLAEAKRHLARRAASRRQRLARRKQRGR